jgi:hypothetical protein
MTPPEPAAARNGFGAKYNRPGSPVETVRAAGAAIPARKPPPAPSMIGGHLWEGVP